MQEPEKRTDENPTGQSEAVHPEIAGKRTIDLRKISFEVDRLDGISHVSPTTNGCAQNSNADARLGFCGFNAITP
jgi:hypothetical protein